MVDDAVQPEDAKEAGRNPIDQKVLRKVAKLMWLTEFNEQQPEATKEQTQQGWNENKKAALMSARRLIRRLEKGNIHLSVRE